MSLPSCAPVLESTRARRCIAARSSTRGEAVNSIETFLSDPIIQLVVFVVLLVGVYDACKFTLAWISKKFGGDDENK